MDIQPFNIFILKWVLQFFFYAFYAHFMVFFIALFVVHKQLHLYWIEGMRSSIFKIIGLNFSNFFVAYFFQNGIF